MAVFVGIATVLCDALLRVVFVFVEQFALTAVLLADPVIVNLCPTLGVLIARTAYRPPEQAFARLAVRDVSIHAFAAVVGVAAPVRVLCLTVLVQPAREVAAQVVDVVELVVDFALALVVHTHPVVV